MSKNVFNSVESTHVGSNTFDLTHDRKFSAKIGRLVPTLVMDVIPGDKINLSSSQMVRFAPLIAPIMHQVSTYMHYFFVPNRLMWPTKGENTGWESFITGGEDGDDEQEWPWIRQEFAPQSDLNSGSLKDYLGIPYTNLNEDTNRQVSALPLAAYAQIYNNYYRDEQFGVKSIDTVDEGDNTSAFSTATLRDRAFSHDYFTSALPWSQKGPEALIPMQGNATVVANIEAIENNPQSGQQTWRKTTSPLGQSSGNISSSASGTLQDTAPSAAFIDLGTSHYADLSSVTNNSIIDLRRAFALQEWLEKNARGGSRYTESLKVHFGIKPQDSRLDRPEFLGGYRTPLKISEVLQTSASSSDVQEFSTPQGNMAGHGVGLGGNNSIAYSVPEHGYIMGIMSTVPRAAYQQGIPKHFLRRDRFDYYWPSFAHIGEQAIEEQELFVGNSQNNLGEDTWGYTPRYTEYKHIQSSVHGSFRKSLDFWHMGRFFNNQPNLGITFIEANWQQFEKIFAVQDGSDNLWCHVLNDISARRKMPVYGTPKL